MIPHSNSAATVPPPSPESGWPATVSQVSRTNPGTAGYPCILPAGTAPGASLHRGAFSPQVAGMNKARRQPVAAHGWQWASQTEAARALGTADSNVSRALTIGTFGKLVMRRLGVRQC